VTVLGVDLKEARADTKAGTAPDLRSDWIEVLIAIRSILRSLSPQSTGSPWVVGRHSSASATWPLRPRAEIGMPEIGFGAYPQFLGAGAQIQLTAKRAAWLVFTAQRIDGRGRWIGAVSHAQGVFELAGNLLRRNCSTSSPAPLTILRDVA
jgi:hypothetical protein